MLSAENWCIKVADKVYGPYTKRQMEKFANEGRLNEASLISPAGAGGIWRKAESYDPIANLLKKEKVTQQSSFGRKRMPSDKSKIADNQVSNFVVIFDTMNGAASRLEHIIHSIGPAFRLADNVWTVASNQTVMGVKNMIAPHLKVRELVFVVDCNRGKTAWQNFTPETHSKLTKAWAPQQ